MMEEQSKLENEAAPITFDRAGVWDGFRQSLGLGISVFAYGLVFGVLARQAGLSLVEAFLMSSLVFAGASQFAVLGLWTLPLPIGPIILTTLIVNLRHLLMGAAIYKPFSQLRPWQRYLSVFFLNDESWALTVGQFQAGKRNGAFLLGSGAALILAWTGATVTGRLIGSALQDPTRWGLDFAFIAVFLALLVGMWQGRANLLPWLAAGVVAVIGAWLLPGKWYILLGGLAGSLVGILQDGD